MAEPERLQGGVERGTERLGEAAREQGERLQDRLERAGELSPEHKAEQIEKARSEASKEALMSQEADKEQQQAPEASAPAIRKVTKQQKGEEYERTMSRTRNHLSAPSRAFSKVIHTPIIEKTSDIAAKTIARPNAILGGSVGAFVFTTLTYVFARIFGYPLSGFETIGSFGLGFILGLLFDFLKTMITGKRS
ncbi:hypothetical protein TM7_0096 [candidate division TM7 genomosp. GTL1]|nr:hypothetical protein TM7_0096 [candidate division TM7 genomosp. GTL1]